MNPGVDTDGPGGYRISRATDRFASVQPGIQSWHCFSAGACYDSSRLGIGPLIAVDEHVLAPGAGFAEHAHRRVDIVSWVLQGVLRHDDDLLVRPGEVLLQRAGMGIRHTESNGGDGPLRLVQITVLSQDDDRSAALVALPVTLGPATFDVHRSGPLDVTGPAFAYVTRGPLTLGIETLTAGDSVTLDRDCTLINSGELLGAGEVLSWQLTEVSA